MPVAHIRPDDIGPYQSVLDFQYNSIKVIVVFTMEFSFKGIRFVFYIATIGDI